MTLSVVQCSCQVFHLITAPIRALFVHIIMVIMTESVKFFMVLLLAFSMGYALFNMWNFNAGHSTSANASGQQEQERLSAGLIENGSFSKYPYVIEMRTSGESLRNNKKH